MTTRPGTADSNSPSSVANSEGAAGSTSGSGGSGSGSAPAEQPAEQPAATGDPAEGLSDQNAADLELLRVILRSQEAHDLEDAEGQHAVGELVGRYQHQLQIYAWRLTGDRQLAEDVVQEIFVRLLSELARLMPIKYCRALLFRMTTNRCLNVKRSLSRRREVSLELNSGRPGETSMAIGSVLAADSQPVTAPLDHAELTDLVLTALDDLPGRQRSAWVLKVLEHRPYSEIAEILDTTVGNCEVLVHRAARRLAQSRNLQKFLNNSG